METAMRKIVRIDEEKCDGCGDCVPSCAEGAIRIIDGKARLVADNLCDGMGACLGECPRGAISIEERPAAEFDPDEVERRMAEERSASIARPMAGVRPHAQAHVHAPHGHGGHACPGSAFRTLRPASFGGPAPRAAPSKPAGGTASSDAGESGGVGGSRLTHWPVQLALVPPSGPIWQDADVLIAADCVPFAMAGFHERLLAGKSLAISCPKLDDMEPHVEKLARIFAGNDVRSVTVAHMEVPCCWGIVRAVEAALEIADRRDIPVRTVMVGVDGEVRDVGR